MKAAFIAYLNQKVHPYQAIDALLELANRDLQYKYRIAHGGPHVLGVTSILRLQLIKAGGINSKIERYYSRIERVDYSDIRRILMA